MGALMKSALIKVDLDDITKVDFSYNDVTIWQDGSFVILRKDEVLKLAEIIESEKQKNEN
jgi:hypothetical protein